MQGVAEQTHRFLLEQPTGRIEIKLIDPQGNVRTESLRRWDILETFLYGDYSHVTQRERLNNWLSGPFAPMTRGFLMMEFGGILAQTLQAILYLAQYAQMELALPQSA